MYTSKPLHPSHSNLQSSVGSTPDRSALEHLTASGARIVCMPQHQNEIVSWSLTPVGRQRTQNWCPTYLSLCTASLSVACTACWKRREVDQNVPEVIHISFESAEDAEQYAIVIKIAQLGLFEKNSLT